MRPLPALLALSVLLLSSCATKSAEVCECESNLVEEYIAPVDEAVAPPEPAAPVSMEGMLRILWRLQSQENVFGFNVYRSESADGPWERANANVIPGHDTTSTPEVYEFWDTGLEVGKTYHYYVDEVTYSGTTATITPVMAGSAKTREHYIERGLLEP
ncbi:MAG: hypothetical protein KF858_04570 [Candidatus Sumerlaeia bacterium]|nr:hypothetical protein [Candidatus Sumerlaeia bacterium]